jgi:hypothetical protein
VAGEGGAGTGDVYFAGIGEDVGPPERAGFADLQAAVGQQPEQERFAKAFGAVEKRG